MVPDIIVYSGSYINGVYKHLVYAPNAELPAWGARASPRRVSNGAAGRAGCDYRSVTKYEPTFF